MDPNILNLNPTELIAASWQNSFKISQTKRKDNVQTVKEWEEKLTSMYQQLMHEENRVANIFYDHLSKFVEKKFFQSKEK
ncbi:15140_t:CDS:2 [Dentiscutata heterogama]|uniref:15140_t:CDS:1 n=1 Tax=Dentiscutata heterogama TaxID=1316150 RepID=A0ACA9JWY4_9GLOM|nr:15140_t:CDS:2 [Dentiscutata heterogama]